MEDEFAVIADWRLAAPLDVPRLAAEFARDGRVRIEPFLRPADAEALRSGLKERADWTQVVSGTNGAVELPRTVRATLPAERLAALDEAVRAEARYGFQYRYETIRVPDGAAERAASDGPVAAFARWLSSEAVLADLRAITGANDVAFADAQATAYGPGDFLTAHDDAVAGKQRRAAYVFSLCPSWRPEWGGLLLFHDDRGRMEGWSPSMNALTLFRVPSPHSVSEVVAQVPVRRYSVTGWLRAGLVR